MRQATAMAAIFMNIWNYSTGRDFLSKSVCGGSSAFFRHPSQLQNTIVSRTSNNPFVERKCDRWNQVGSRKRFSRQSTTVRRAKFQQFERKEKLGGDDVVEAVGGPILKEAEGESVRDDEVLPDSLEGALLQASKSASVFVQSGGSRGIVELLVPELENLTEEGAQQRVWECARVFLDEFQRNLGGQQKVKALFPDAGVAAMLRYQWDDSNFSIASLNDRKPVESDDEAVVMVIPDFQMLETVERIAAALKDADGLPQPLLMWNPRLVSGDVGVGLNVRRLRENFLSTFTNVYLLRPLSAGAIYRNYPSLFKLFLDDPDKPGRYLLYRDQESRPDLDDIESLYMAIPGNGTAEDPEEISPLAKAFNVFSSLSRFMKSLSR